ncbi:MAG: HlyD family type I secretion periplasmic adaptor subunit [Hydrogenophaga sp.]
MHAQRGAGQGVFLAVIGVAVLAFVGWAMTFRIDEVARAGGQVIASSRVQVIQAVDGGVLRELRVREGDRVAPGQVLAKLEQTRPEASLGEVESRLFASRARAARLRAEVLDESSPMFPVAENPLWDGQVRVENALFMQRRAGLRQDLEHLQKAVELARSHLGQVNKLLQTGDVSGSEVLRARRDLNDAEGRLANARNRFLEQAQQELASTENEIAQLEQTQLRRRQELADTVFTAKVAGIVKNVRVTTIGGVLRAGEEILQIVPADDELIVEAKVSPVDISRVSKGQSATLRFDAYDYSIYGSVAGEVIYVSADTLTEESQRGSELYYRVHVRLKQAPVRSSTGRMLEIFPGMTAQVDIRAGDRTLMEYLLKPLRKTLSESFKER